MPSWVCFGARVDEQTTATLLFIQVPHSVWMCECIWVLCVSVFALCTVRAQRTMSNGVKKVAIRDGLCGVGLLFLRHTRFITGARRRMIV